MRTNTSISTGPLIQSKNSATIRDKGARRMSSSAKYRDLKESSFVSISCKSLAAKDLQEIETKLDSFKSRYFGDEDIRLAPLSRIVAEFFDWIRGPVEIDVLVRMMAYLLDIRDQPIESFNELSPQRWDGHFTANTQSSGPPLAAN